MISLDDARNTRQLSELGKWTGAHPAYSTSCDRRFGRGTTASRPRRLTPIGFGASSDFTSVSIPDPSADRTSSASSHISPLERRVAAATQNQALSALLFLYEAVLEIELPWLQEVVRAKRSQHVPVVLTRSETQRVLAQHQVAPLSGFWAEANAAV